MSFVVGEIDFGTPDTYQFIRSKIAGAQPQTLDVHGNLISPEDAVKMGTTVEMTGQLGQLALGDQATQQAVALPSHTGGQVTGLQDKGTSGASHIAGNVHGL